MLAASRPDALVRVDGRALKGDDRYTGRQRVSDLRRTGQKAEVQVWLQSDGARPDRLAYEVKGRSSRFAVRSAHLAGGRTPQLQPGEPWTLRLTVVRRAAARPGQHVLVRIPATSVRSGRKYAVSVQVTARR